MSVFKFDEENREELSARIVTELRTGSVWGLNADSAYALATDAFSYKGLKRLHEMRGRAEFATPVLIGREVHLQGLVPKVTDGMQALIDAFWPGPLTIVAKPNPSLAWAATAGAVSIRMPANDDTRAIAWDLGPMVGVGAKRAEVTPLTAAEGDELWGAEVQSWLDSGAADPELLSTVVDFRGVMPNIIRLGALSARDLRAVLPSVTLISQ